MNGEGRGIGEKRMEAGVLVMMMSAPAQHNTAGQSRNPANCAHTDNYGQFGDAMLMKKFL